MKIERISLDNILKVTDLFDQYRVFYDQPSDPERAERFLSARQLNNESIIFAAIDDRGVAVGFTQLYPKFSSVRTIKNWILNDLFVLPSNRNQGIATLLIKTARIFAIENSAKFLQLETAVTNTAAQNLYEAIGFEKQATDTDFLTYRLSL